MTGVGPFTNLDLAVIAIVVLSGLVAMYRGLTREVLSILSWAAAAGAVFYFIRYHKDIAEEVAKQFANPVQTSYVYVAQVAIGGLIFLVVLIIVHLVTARISDSVLDSRVGAIDRILGLAFGMVRGFVLIAVSFVCKDNPARSSAQGCRPGELPGWVENAQSLPLINQTSGTLFSLLSRYAPSVPLGTGEQRQGWLRLDHNSPNAAPGSNSS
jgi:membrane protein required for colicin V production